MTSPVNSHKALKDAAAKDEEADTLFDQMWQLRLDAVYLREQAKLAAMYDAARGGIEGPRPST